MISHDYHEDGDVDHGDGDDHHEDGDADHEMVMIIMGMVMLIAMKMVDIVTNITCVGGLR